jgi:flagellar biosynthesis protein FlhA
MEPTDKRMGIERVGAFLRRYADWLIGVGLLGLVLTLITPIPAPVLDVLLAFNIAVSLLLLLVTMNTRTAVELSSFPTLLLLTTLLRLGLNVASTRLILTGGHAGAVISAFGNYVAGDNLTVGFIVFLILIVIQFVVITRGSGRISEVAARFVLDAMPGKQMAIDADLNGGLIDQDEARFRRENVAREAEFYGAMDGASKFVRGDAIAGLIITVLNLAGGIAIGTAGDLSLSSACERYSMLTIGDGLVSQIPALFVSTAAAMIVTKASSRDSFGFTLLSQMGSRPKATAIGAGMLFVLGLLPGMPSLPFFVLATVLLAGWRATRWIESPDDLQAKASGEPAPSPAGAEEKDPLGELLSVDRVALEIGYRLIPLVQDPAGTGILDHVAQLRRRFAQNEGIVLPPVRIKDNIRLAPNAYRILLGGQEVASGAVEPGQFLAMDGGSASGVLRGVETTDPTFGLPARWIQKTQRDEAEVLGYTVIDPTSVVVTHLAETLRAGLGEVLNRDDVKHLLENAKKISPAIVEELSGERCSLGELQAILRNLLREGVSIRNLPAILEVVSDHLGRTKDPEQLTELVRQRLGRALCEMHADKSGKLFAVTLDPSIENKLASAVGAQASEGAGSLSPAFLQHVVERVGASVAAATKGGREVVVLARSSIRRFLSELVRAALPKVAVLSYNEVVPAKSVETLAIVKMED